MARHSELAPRGAAVTAPYQPSELAAAADGEELGCDRARLVQRLRQRGCARRFEPEGLARRVAARYPAGLAAAEDDAVPSDDDEISASEDEVEPRRDAARLAAPARPTVVARDDGAAVAD